MPQGRNGKRQGVKTSASRGRKGSQVCNGGERVTRSSRAKLTNGLDDPAQVEKELNAQLRSMGLYAANITGDGNCLFRALSDQLYGYSSQHTQLRKEVCDYLQAKPEKFAGFVDVEKPFDEYVRTMRQSGTYGGHLELSAFAQLVHKEIKIVQPGLVYVVSGHDESSQATQEMERLEKQRLASQNSSTPGTECSPPSDRALRKIRRSQKEQMESDQDGKSSEPSNSIDRSESVDEVDRQLGAADEKKPLEAFGPLWIAYHNWEHYSSIRNIEGPHTGLPRVREKPLAGSSGNASQNGTSPDTDAGNAQPTEEEELVLRSTRGYTLEQIRFYIKRHGGWEEALEAILAQEAVDNSEEEHAKQNSERGSGHERSIKAHGPMGRNVMEHTEGIRYSPVPERLREWRTASPSSVDTTGTTRSSLERASASPHPVTDESVESASTGSKAHTGVREVRRSKRNASKDPTTSLRSPKRRSRSRSPLQTTMVNDIEGAMAAHAIANIRVDSDTQTGDSTPDTDDSKPAQAVDVQRTPRAKMDTTPRSVNRTLTMRERRELRKADKVRRALEGKAKRQQRAAQADSQDEEEENSLHDGRRAKPAGALPAHATDPKGILELKI